jgi:ribosome-associated protein
VLQCLRPERTDGSRGGSTLEAIDLARAIVDAVEDKKAEDIVLLDLRPDAIIADFFVICNGLSDRQLRALTDNVREVIKEKYGKLPFSVEGTPESGWMLMDYGDVVLHAFIEAKRRYYDLEGLWRSAHILLRIQ